MKGVEIVRQVAELPVLHLLHGSTSRLQLGDWLLLVQPETSDIWWDRMMSEVEKWYQDHQAMAPLERVKHEPVPPASLSVPKWAKLERRMATLLLKAIPEVQKDELVATKRLSVFAILAHLHVTYCPGGISGKQMLLRNLEDPTEPANLHETVVGLRRQLRWRARAQEIGATEPDPSILVKGLNRLTKRILDGNGKSPLPGITLLGTPSKWTPLWTPTPMLSLSANSRPISLPRLSSCPWREAKWGDHEKGRRKK